jgi:hypothetical protein
MNIVMWTAQLLEFLGGSCDQAPAGFPRVPAALFWGIWWGALSAVIYIFCGQSSKFIYIDF